MMGRRGIFIVLLLVVALFLYLGYTSYDSKRAGVSGDVYPATGRAKVEPVVTAPVPEQTEVNAPSATGAQQAMPVTPETAQGGVAGGDMVNPNPPNGMRFSGSGRYQLYRQGNITWRLDTTTGKTCIVFATEEEWKKPLVYRNGCGKR
jgi:hypothetical protein